MQRRIDRGMFYGAKRGIFVHAESLRKNMTHAEKLLWNVLRNRNLFREKWRRQHPIDIFIADFYCHNLKIVIEIDGDIHNLKSRKEYDDGRAYELERYGIKVLRFTNKEITETLDAVVERLISEINKKV